MSFIIPLRGIVESLYTRARGGPFPFGNTTDLTSAV